MARTALVTGGTRGIGAAISQALKADGHMVAATYSSNDEAAEAFKAETGIAVYKWNVGDFDACQEGIAKVTVVGVGMRTHSGIAAKVFETLASGGINIEMISTSEIKISVVVELGKGEAATQQLHNAFFPAET